MATIAPFRAVRPKPELAAQVAAPPYDVVSLEEARDRAKGNPYSFLRVSRAELELQGEIDPYSPTVYEKGAENLRNLLKDGILRRDAFVAEPGQQQGSPVPDRRKQSSNDRLRSAGNAPQRPH